MKKLYELTYLISTDLSEEEAKELQAKVVSLIQEEGGLILEERSPFKKKLAFPIKKQIQAFLANINFQTIAEKISKLEKNIKTEKKILRYLILTKKPIKKVKPIRSLKTMADKKPKKEKKAELKEIEKKLDEMLEK